jgi:prepilin-type N-terminal cleavage/methylation domain-containing protein
MRNVQTKMRHDSCGMTLVELLVVVTMLSVVMMAVMSLYIPVLQSTVAQTQVSDVQSNLRLAVSRMTKDLLTAGFLVPTNPIIFEASTTPTTGENTDAVDFTIRTRAVGSAFARVDSAALVSGNIQITPTDPDMADLFPEGSMVRLFEPMTGNELNAGTGSPSDRAYEVMSSPSGTISIDPGVIITDTDVLSETVVLKVRDASQPALQTIRYRLVDGSLTREVNGTVQYLARNVDNVNFTYDKTPEGRVRRVDIQLTGITKALKNDAISGAKTRQVNTSVSLRNVY